ncbi:MAG: hypothetical protein MJH10_01010 [Epibacterium sp.]|nr:hypothetical protein [Epibacterium sp.]NQX72140.1 hypothetical protein [Epibacterium sp.]
MKKRKSHSPAIKYKVAFDAIREAMGLAQLCKNSPNADRDLETGGN